MASRNLPPSFFNAHYHAKVNKKEKQSNKVDVKEKHRNKQIKQTDQMVNYFIQLAVGYSDAKLPYSHPEASGLYSEAYTQVP